MEKPVLFEVEDGVAIITLNRPHRRNAINQALLTHLYEYIDEVTEDDSIRVAILTGNGKSFCSGIDLDVVLMENLADPRGDGKDLPDIIDRCKKPIIGAINGHAITGGLEIALNCDFLIASENASFADTHINMGVHPGWGMIQLLRQTIGPRMTKQMSLSGEHISAEKALRWGLVNEVVPHDRLLSRAKQIANGMRAANQDILRMMKNLIEYGDRSTVEEAIAHERRSFKEFAITHLMRE
ncbi:MAG: enoyl-CoA hydratase [Chloroflexota bacterium]|nr:enoyl-CoA hydratase [Chloroflexota bacterium]